MKHKWCNSKMMQLELFCNGGTGRMWNCPCFWKSLTTTDVYIKDVLFLFFVLHEQNIFIMSAQKWSIFVAHYPQHVNRITIKSWADIIPIYIWIWDSFAPIWSSHWRWRVLVTVSIKDGGSYSDWFLKPWRVFSFQMQVYFYFCFLSWSYAHI